jgi:hypothetical protein
MTSIDLSDNAAVNYDTAAELFDYGSEAEKSSTKFRKFRRQVTRYRRFRNAADAIRFAIEELPAKSLATVCLQVDEVRFNGRAIRQLYDCVEYPLVRRCVR